MADPVQRITVYAPPGLQDRIEAHAGRRQVSSWLVTLALAELARLEGRKSPQKA